jgi:hypothetical protein
MYFYFAIDTISYSCARQVDTHNPIFFLKWESPCRCINLVAPMIIIAHEVNTCRIERTQEFIMVEKRTNVSRLALSFGATH